MKNLIGFALALLLPGARIGAATPDKNTIVTLENAIWRSVQDKKPDQFKQLVSANVSTVFADGIQTMQDELKAIPKRTMKSASLADFKVTCPDSRPRSSPTWPRSCRARAIKRCLILTMPVPVADG